MLAIAYMPGEVVLRPRQPIVPVACKTRYPASNGVLSGQIGSKCLVESTRSKSDKHDGYIPQSKTRRDFVARGIETDFTTPLDPRPGPGPSRIRRGNAAHARSWLPSTRRLAGSPTHAVTQACHDVDLPVR